MYERKMILTGATATVVSTILLVLLITTTTPVFALNEGSSGVKQIEHAEHLEQAGEAEQNGEAEHGFNWWGFLGKTFNSILLFGGLIYLLRKPLIALLAQKSEAVKSSIIEREEQLDIQSTYLKKIQERLTKIEDEIQSIRISAEKSGRDEKKNIEAAAENEAQRILAMTEEEIANKMETAVHNLKERIANLTIDYFKKDIEAHLSPQMHERLIEKNIAVLSGDGIERK